MAEVRRFSRAFLPARLLVARPCVVPDISYSLASDRSVVPHPQPGLFVPIYSSGSAAPARRGTQREVDVVVAHRYRRDCSLVLGGATQFAGDKRVGSTHRT